MTADGPPVLPTSPPAPSGDQDDGPNAPARASRAPRMEGPDLGQLERLLGDLVVEGEIAHTSRAAVHRVRVGTQGDRPLALKVALRPSDSGDLARFRHEARLLSEVRHPNVVGVRELGVLPGGFPFLVMELVEPFHRTGSPSWSEVYDLALQAAAGLAHIHRLGVVHLDVKPGNLGFAAGDAETAGASRRLKILDFGLAQDLRDPLDRRIRGTLAYMAPEVLLQDTWDHRADLYSLGLTLLEIATGELPSATPERSDEAAIRFHLEGEPPDPRTLRSGMPEPLAEILERLLRRDPRERFPSAGRLLEELGRASGRQVEPGELARLALGSGTVLTSRLVGRSEELGRLTAAFEEARSGRSRVLLCEGAEGVGKSRLLREFRLLAAVRGARVGFGRAEGEGSRPLRPVLQALAHLGIEVHPPETASPAADDERGRFLLYREISRRLAQASRSDEEASAPLVLALEDLHLAGPETAELLQFLAADLGPSMVLVVGCRRPGDAAPGASGETAGAADAEAVEHLELRPLDREATARLVEASLGLERRDALPETVLTWLEERGGGLPGRIQQLLRHAIDEGGLVLRDGGWKMRPQVIDRLTRDERGLDWQRLEALPEPLRELLEAGAVVGAPFALQTVTELLDRDAEPIYRDLDELVARGFLERSHEGDATLYAFSSEHLRASLYEGIDGSRLVELHGVLAGLLEARLSGGEAELVAEVAEHYWRAGRRAASLPHLLAAADRAAAVHGHAEAAGLCRRAMQAAEAAGDAEAAVRATVGQARALARTGHTGRALHLYQQLLGRPETLDGDHRLEARLALDKGRLHGRLGEHELALTAFDAGLGSLKALRSRDADVLELESELRHGRAVALRDLGHADAAFDAARSALRRAGEAGLDRQRAFLLNTLSRMFYARGDWKRAGRLARRGLRVAEATADRWLEILLRNSLAMVHWKTGEFRSALELFGENLAASEHLNDPWGQLTALNNLGILRCSRGEWKEARRLLDRALSMNRR
ncbi:MAG: protein kinase, partial [Acidobacteriota bacterium]